MPQKIVSVSESGDGERKAEETPVLDDGDSQVRWIHALIAGAKLWRSGDAAEPDDRHEAAGRRRQVRTNSK